jgi:hypothetical protein
MRACFLSEIYGIKKAGLIGETSPPSAILYAILVSESEWESHSEMQSEVA